MRNLPMKKTLLTYLSTAALCLFAAGCAKQAAKVNPPPAPVYLPQQEAAPVVQRAPQPPAPAPVDASTKSDMPDTATKMRIQDLINRIQDAYFDYDKHNLRPDAINTLQTDARTLAQILSQYPKFSLTVEGYCDERGSAEYN